MFNGMDLFRPLFNLSKRDFLVEVAEFARGAKSREPSCGYPQLSAHMIQLNSRDLLPRCWQAVNNL